jgi:hypothetical protein
MNCAYWLSLIAIICEEGIRLSSLRPVTGTVAHETSARASVAADSNRVIPGRRSIGDISKSARFCATPGYATGGRASSASLIARARSGTTVKSSPGLMKRSYSSWYWRSWSCR